MHKLIFSKLYHSDLDESYSYISENLENPVAADRLIIEAKDKLIEIRKNPTHRPLVNDEYLANLGYRLKKSKKLHDFLYNKRW